MASRKPPARNNHLEEAMALLIHNQTAFVEQIARNDRERLALQRNAEEWQRKSDDQQRKNDERQRKNEDQQRKNEERFDRIEARLASIEANLIQLPKTILQTVFDQLPKIKKEIGFKSPA